jgi:hypothetical protein
MGDTIGDLALDEVEILRRAGVGARLVQHPAIVALFHLALPYGDVPAMIGPVLIQSVLHADRAVTTHPHMMRAAVGQGGGLGATLGIGLGAGGGAPVSTCASGVAAMRIASHQPLFVTRWPQAMEEATISLGRA